MYLLTQDEQAIFDFDRCGFVACNDKGEVFIGGNAGSTGYVVGTYPTKERAKEVVSDIFVNLEMSRYEMPMV